VIGKEATGKTTFLEALRATLGDYAAVGNFETFMPRKYADGPRHDIANFAGVRLIVVEEIPKGGKLDEHVFNRLTGGSKQRARQLHEREFELEPTYHVVFAANNPPRVRTDEPGAWRRILRVPFTNQIPAAQRNPEIKNCLRTPEVSGSAILAWMVAGC